MSRTECFNSEGRAEMFNKNENKFANESCYYRVSFANTMQTGFLVSNILDVTCIFVRKIILLQLHRRNEVFMTR